MSDARKLHARCLIQLGSLVALSGLADLLKLEGDLQKNPAMFDGNATLLGGLVFLRQLLEGPHGADNAARLKKVGVALFQRQQHAAKKSPRRAPHKAAVDVAAPASPANADAASPETKTPPLGSPKRRRKRKPAAVVYRRVRRPVKALARARPASGRQRQRSR